MSFKNKVLRNALERSSKKFSRSSIRTRLIIIFTFTSFIVFSVNMYMYANINNNLKVLDNIYVSNVSLNELMVALDSVQTSMYEYLNTKSTNSLERYYVSEQTYHDYIDKLNDETSDNKTILTEKNIKNMSLHYLKLTNQTVQAKRGRNIQKYKKGYEDASKLNQYINTIIYTLNNNMFKNNSAKYELLLVSLKYLEFISTTILLVISLFNVILIVFMTRSITNPLSNLVKAANEVAMGNFNIELIETGYEDEVSVVSKAFNKMIINIREYIEKVRQSMEFQSRTKEKELIMETHLKDAQLKYLQAQINPHFLFNTLNAGAQLAMMEGAEKTSIFTEKMADFFRYNIKKINEDASLEEEIELVENYLYIMNVRFSGEIHFTKEVDSNFLSLRVPSMVLQPIIENAVTYGIRDIDWEANIKLSVYLCDNNVCISVKDNGKGMTTDKIEKIMKGESKQDDSDKNSNGIGLGNVISRLKLYYGVENVIKINSGVVNQGTELILYIPNLSNERGPTCTK